MRLACLSFSFLVAICGFAASGAAQDVSPYRQAGYSQSDVSAWDSEEAALADPRYDWELSDAPYDINSLYGIPQLDTYFQADVLWLSRNHAVSKTVAVTLPPASQAVLNASDASLSGDFQPGALLTWGRRLDLVSAFEITFFGFNTWQNSAQTTGAADLSLPGTLPLLTRDYIFADKIHIDYESSIYNAEANYTQTIAGLKLLTGFRYVRLNESFDLNSTVALQNGQNSSSDYLIRAKNNLMGGQIGIGFDSQWDRLTVDMLTKWGVYANVAEQNTLMKDFNNTVVIRNFQDHTTAVSVLGEIQLNASYRIFDWLSIRGGYRFMWINNLALAPNQLDFGTGPTAGASVDAHDYLYIHGVNVGLEARW